MPWGIVGRCFSRFVIAACRHLRMLPKLTNVSETPGDARLAKELRPESC
jgi:hypothetical protein